jgi:hypothetical protein
MSRAAPGGGQSRAWCCHMIPASAERLCRRGGRMSAASERSGGTSRAASGAMEACESKRRPDGRFGFRQPPLSPIVGSGSVI